MQYLQLFNGLFFSMYTHTHTHTDILQRTLQNCKYNKIT